MHVAAWQGVAHVSNPYCIWNLWQDFGVTVYRPADTHTDRHTITCTSTATNRPGAARHFLPDPFSREYSTPVSFSLPTCTVDSTLHTTCHNTSILWVAYGGSYNHNNLPKTCTPTHEQTSMFSSQRSPWKPVAQEKLKPATKQM